jgi:hypothetical protein
MIYPNIEQVNNASHEQICSWWRFLHSPGLLAIGTSDFQVILDHEVIIMNRIAERYKELGGMTPAISKHIGWK